MKKFVAAALTAVCVLGTCLPGFAVQTAQIKLNGELCDIPPEYGTVFVQNDRTYVPVRFVSEQLNCGVAWDEAEQLILITDLDNSIAFQVGASFFFHGKVTDGALTRTDMDVEVLYNEEEYRTYVPVRFLAEALGYTVGWDEATDTVTLDKAE